MLSQNRQKTLCLFKIVTLRFRFKSGGGLKAKFDDIAPNINYLPGFFSVESGPDN